MIPNTRTVKSLIAEVGSKQTKMDVLDTELLYPFLTQFLEM